MWSCFDPWRTGAALLDALAVTRGTHAVLAARQQSRLAALLQAAARGSPLYRERLDRGRRTSLCDVPPVDKSELMQRFDEWVTDPRLRLAPLRAFVADASRIGDAFEGDFVVWESSGSSGEPAMFVQDARALAVYDALEACRGASRWLDSWRVDDRIAFVGATGGHFASNVSVERLRRLNPGIAQRVRSFSFLQRTDALVEQLNRHAPAIVATYPTAAVLLAEEHAGDG
jgi:phenylacetate-CoA ligase